MMRLNKTLSIVLAAALLPVAVSAQDAMGTVSYALPQTTITLEVEAVRESFYAGPYAKFAQKYLGVNARQEDQQEGAGIGIAVPVAVRPLKERKDRAQRPVITAQEETQGHQARDQPAADCGASGYKEADSAYDGHGSAVQGNPALVAGRPEGIAFHCREQVGVELAQEQLLVSGPDRAAASEEKQDGRQEKDRTDQDADSHAPDIEEEPGRCLAEADDAFIQQQGRFKNEPHDGEQTADAGCVPVEQDGNTH